MAGQIKDLLDQIVKARSQGDRTIALTTKTKLILKGVNPNKYNRHSQDDPEIIARVKEIAQELGVTI